MKTTTPTYTTTAPTLSPPSATAGLSADTWLYILRRSQELGLQSRGILLHLRLLRASNGVYCHCMEPMEVRTCQRYYLQRTGWVVRQQHGYMPTGARKRSYHATPALRAAWSGITAEQARIARHQLLVLLQVLEQQNPKTRMQKVSLLVQAAAAQKSFPAEPGPTGEPWVTATMSYATFWTQLIELGLLRRMPRLPQDPRRIHYRVQATPIALQALAIPA